MHSYNVDDKGALGDIVGGDAVVAAEEEDHLGLRLNGPEIDAQFHCIDFALTSVQHVEAVPALFSVDEPILVGDFPGGGDHACCVGTGDCVMSDNHHGQFG